MSELPPRRRKRVPGGGRRTEAVLVKLSTAEHEAIQVRAEAARMSVAAYLAERGQEDLAATSASGTGISAVQLASLVAEFYALKRILRGAGNNLNQLTRVANARGSMDPESMWHARRIDAVLPRVEQLCEQFRSLVDPS
jgi:Mobilization protein NikA